MKKVFWLFACLLSSSGSAIGNTIPANSAQEKPIAILFVGNSLTYTNNLPALVTKLAKEAGIAIQTTTLAYPNYAIEDHWNDVTAFKLLQERKYSFLILQQGPSSQSEGRKMLLDYGKKFKTLCQENNTQLVFFMVWPSLRYYRSFDKVIQNYADAAAKNSALLCPVGTVWKTYIDETGNLDYYGADGFHPSEKGSNVAAKVILQTLFPEFFVDDHN